MNMEFKVVERRIYTPGGTLVERVEKADYWIVRKGRKTRIGKKEFDARLERQEKLAGRKEVLKELREEKRPERKGRVKAVWHVKVDYHSPRGAAYDTFVEFWVEKVYESREDAERDENYMRVWIETKMQDGSIGGGLSPDHLANVYGKPGFAREIGVEYRETDEFVTVGDPEIRDIEWKRSK